MATAVMSEIQLQVPVWSPLKRIGFRIAFLYFSCFLFLFGNGTLFTLIPVVGDKIDEWLTWPFNHLAEWVGQHLFHLTGTGAHWHPTGSGDTQMNWILNGLFIVMSMAGGVIWTIFAKRSEYAQAFNWLRFLLRFTCGIFMLGYGLDKVFPLQMAPISIGILNEPVGQMSPMTFLWALIGMNPAYETVCGLAEVAGGVLFLFRRTALLGALLSAFVMTNVVLYNFFFDVPVKLFAVSLLLACLFVALPDMKALVNFFLLSKPVALSSVWVPQFSRRGFRHAIRAVEIVYLCAAVIFMPIRAGSTWNRVSQAASVQSPMLGAWKLDSNHPASGAFITPDGLPATDLYIDTVARAFIRSTDRTLWRTRMKLDAPGHKIQITCYVKDPVDYTWYMPDGDHLMLKSKTDLVTLTRVPVPAHYPLLERGFHFVNEWGLER